MHKYQQIAKRIELEVDEVDELVEAVEVVDVVRVVPVEPGTGTPAWVLKAGMTTDEALDGATTDDCTIDEGIPGADTVDEATLDGGTTTKLLVDVGRVTTATVVPDTTVTDEPGLGRAIVEAVFDNGGF